ncbi:MAG: hypothetical protein V1659_04680 [Candidatus Woesearchaeota archaeon]
MTKKLIKEVVSELVGEEALPIIFFLKDRTMTSEFVVAEELDIEIHQIRNILYRLLEHNIVTFIRKKDKIKGWYICYWDFNENIIPYLSKKLNDEKIKSLKDRLDKESENNFFMCRSACTRMDFEKAMEFQFKCPECGQLMHEQDNARTIQFLQERIRELGSKCS